MEDNELTTDIKSLKSKRLVALIIDLMVCFFVSLIFSIIPFINRVFSWPVVFLGCFLVKDALFEGKGIGKNFLGIQVVDSGNAGIISYKQSIIRNLVLVFPLLIYDVVIPLLTLFIKNAVTMNIITTIVVYVGALYFAVVVLSESYKAFILNNTVRLGDKMAKTDIVITNN